MISITFLFTSKQVLQTNNFKDGRTMKSIEVTVRLKNNTYLSSVFFVFSIISGLKCYLCNLCVSVCLFVCVFVCVSVCLCMYVCAQPVDVYHRLPDKKQ